ncbi:unnamed protein product, partial [Ectocarpus sp. 8 AP-2014]
PALGRRGSQDTTSSGGISRRRPSSAHVVLREGGLEAAAAGVGREYRGLYRRRHLRVKEPGDVAAAALPVGRQQELRGGGGGGGGRGSAHRCRTTTTASFSPSSAPSPTLAGGRRRRHTA